MHKKQPGKSVKTKRTKGIYYFAIKYLLSCHTEICKTDGAFKELQSIHSRSTVHVQRLWEVHSDKQTEGQISIFNIIDYYTM